MGNARTRPHVWWACNGCSEQFDLDWNQYVRWKLAKQSAQSKEKRFYCKECRLDGKSHYVNPCRDTGTFTDETVEAAWSKYADPNYYAGVRHSYATPLSWQDRGVRIARATKART